MTDPTPANPTMTLIPKPEPMPSFPLESPSLPNGKPRQSLASPPTAAGTAVWNSPLTPTTFTSLLPIVDGLLGTLARLAGSEDRIDGPEAGKAVVGRARELFSSLEAMKTAALDLPGAHLTTERIGELTQMMRVEADLKRDTLRQLAAIKMPIAEQFQRSGEGVGGEDGEGRVQGV